MKLILASSSPRRRDLLTAAGFDFETASAEIAEVASPAFTIRELTSWNAQRKVLALAARNHNAVVLGADTLVALDDNVIGKPENLAHAREILRELSGRTHQVCTGVCVVSGPRRETFAVTTNVRFRVLDEESIGAYLRAIDPLDKAGAYAAQGDDGTIIAQIDGSFTNVVGLPMDETVHLLHAFGVHPRRSVS